MYGPNPNNAWCKFGVLFLLLIENVLHVVLFQMEGIPRSRWDFFLKILKVIFPFSGCEGEMVGAN